MHHNKVAEPAVQVEVHARGQCGLYDVRLNAHVQPSQPGASHTRHGHGVQGAVQVLLCQKVKRLCYVLPSTTQERQSEHLTRLLCTIWLQDHGASS